MRSVTRVLLLEDNPSDALLLEATLAEASPGYEVTHVERLTLGIARLTSGAFDIVLADLSLPDSHGVSTVEQLRQAAPDTPVVVLSGLDDEETALKAVQAGAEGYLVKWRFGASLLTRTMAHAIEHRQQLSRLEERLATLEAQQALLERVLEAMAEAVIAIDGEGVVALANDAAAEALGRAAADLRSAFVGKVEQSTAARTLAVLAVVGATPPTDVRVTTAEGGYTLLLFGR